MEGRQSGSGDDGENAGDGEDTDNSGQYEITRWNPSTVAQVNTHFAHSLGVSEVWSYVMAAARSTYERPSPQHPDDPIKYRLKAFVLNERESIIPSNLAVLTSSKQVDPKDTGRLLIHPDATFESPRGAGGD